MGGIDAALAEHAFEHLFVECLGWDRVGAATAVLGNDTTLDQMTVDPERGEAAGNEDAE